MVKYEKGLALVASVKTKGGDVVLNGVHYGRDVVRRVDRATAKAAEASGRFLVAWDTPENVERAQSPEPTPTPAEEPVEEELSYDEVLQEYDGLRVAETLDYLLQYDDVELVKFLATNARWKGSRANAKERLEELKG